VPAAAGNQTVTITATDSHGASGSASFSLVVTSNSAAPQITLLTSSNPDPTRPSADGRVTIAGAFSDPAGKATIAVNWGDGSPAQPATVNAAASIFAGNHRYASGGIYTVTVTLTEGATVVSQTTTAVVAGVGVVDGVLYVIGGDAAVDVWQIGGRSGDYQVTVGQGDRKQVFTFRADAVSSIVIVAGADDRVRVQPGVSATVVRVPDDNDGQGRDADDFVQNLASVLRSLRRHHGH
jgi:hypothetical protein